MGYTTKEYINAGLLFAGGLILFGLGIIVGYGVCAAGGWAYI